MEKLIKRFKAAVPPGPAAATMIEGWMHKMANAGLPAALTGKESSESLAAAIEELRLLDPQLLEAYMVIGEVGSPRRRLRKDQRLLLMVH